MRIPLRPLLCLTLPPSLLGDERLVFQPTVMEGGEMDVLNPLLRISILDLPQVLTKYTGRIKRGRIHRERIKNPNPEAEFTI